MSSIPDATDESSGLRVAPMVPIDNSAWTWTRFINAFEVSEFTNWQDESLSWKKTAYIGDWSQAHKLRVRGPEAHAFFAFLSTMHWPNFRMHQCKHAIMCRDDGMIVGEGLVMKLGSEDFIFTGGPPAIEWAKFQHKQGRRRFNCAIEDVSKEWYLFQIQGPKSIEIMEAATGTGIKDLFFMNAKEMSINGMEFLALRQGVSGERGYELWGPAKDAHAIYKAIVAAGESFGLRQLGMRTKLVNHVEAAVSTPISDFLPAVYGNDPEIKKYLEYLEFNGINTSLFRLQPGGNYSSDPAVHQHSPYDLGWEKFVDLSPEHEFIGRETLVSIAANPPNKWVALEWNSEDVIDVYASLFREESHDYMELPRIFTLHADSVYLNEELIGSAFSRCYSYWFKKMISNAILSRQHSTPGTEVVLKWGSGEHGPQKMIRAIVKEAPYKHDVRRKKIEQ
ncbi:hypothetical protein ACHAQE_010838 [Botrytis cinerea]